MLRKKITLGKINLDLVGVKEADIVYDCIADLFQRDEKAGFPQIQTFFDNQGLDVDNAHDEDIIITLRQLIAGKVNINIIRIYSETDPTLGKILRNLRNAVDRSTTFTRITRFNEVMLIPCESDLLFHRAPMQFEYLRQEFSRSVLIHDTIPQMLEKLHALLVTQNEYQRMVALVTAALLFKEVYSIAWESEQETAVAVEQNVYAGDVKRIAGETCKKIQSEMYPHYVEQGKCSEKQFAKYMFALNDILIKDFTDEGASLKSYYDCLKTHMPRLTKNKYAVEHRAILEYLVKMGKEKMRENLKA